MLFSDLFDSLSSIVSTIRFIDIVDILFVAALFYMIISYFHSSSMVRIAFGIVLVILITALTEVLNMRMTNFILSRIIEIGIIALVILFQPELRRTLERVGAKSLHLFNSRKNDITASKQDIAKIVSACETMAKEKTGVLLVLERDYALDDYFKTGTVVDAEISSELLRNLFFTKAALHDGAVIIRDDRIAAAGCVLPLTENTSISSDLGTRHRAGIGMSEATDAVVIIVSEETGCISTAIGGMLKRNLTPELLRKQLITEMHLDDPVEKETAAKKVLRLLKNGKEGKGDKQNER